MTDKTQPTAHAEITAPISADLRRMPGLSEQGAGLLEQAASMLEGLQSDERNRGNCSTAEGAACSAHAARRLAVQLLRAVPEEQAQGLLQEAANRIKDMLQGDDGQAFKEARKFLERLDAAQPSRECLQQSAALVVMPTLGSTIMSDACWKFIEVMPHQLPGRIFNDLKPAVFAAVQHVHAALQAAPPAPAAVAVPDALAAALIRLDAIYRAEADDGEFKPRPDWLVTALRFAAAPAQEHATQLAGQGPDLREHLRWSLQRIRRLDHETGDASCGARFSGAVAALERADAMCAWSSDAAAPAQAQEDARDGLTQAARDVLAERARQVDAEGFNHARDDEYVGRQLAGAAASYLILAAGGREDEARAVWPWRQEWLNPSDQRRYLEKAGALALAEMERLDRAAARAAQGGA